MTDINLLYSFDAGFSLKAPLAGVDEAGRGPLAGPVVAAAVILPPDMIIEGLDDSKRLTPARRRRAAGLLRQNGAIVAIGLATAVEIDAFNILAATMKAMQRAVARLDAVPGLVLVDGNRSPALGGVECRCITGGDGRSASIAAASIAAKVYRDELMLRYDAVYPGYNFAGHKGYGTAEHLRALEELGPSPIHRLSFAPLNNGRDEGATSGNPGAAAETEACVFLKKRGYSIRERNYRLRVGELDIVAEKDGLIVFVEVKMRSGRLCRPSEAVDKHSRRRLLRTAEVWLALKAPGAVCRFDVMEVVPAPEGYAVDNHLQDAFRD